MDKYNSLYDALIKCNVSRLSEESLKVLETIDYGDFPMYGNLMKTNLRNNKQKSKLIESAKMIVDDLIKRKKLPLGIIKRIVCELGNRDLRNLVSCCSTR